MSTGNGGGEEARRLLDIAEKLLDARDLVGSKRFAERALESDPLLEGVDQILAVIDVLLASRCRVGNQPDWYSILQLPHPSSSSASGGNSSIDIKRGYRRLALLLSSDRNKFPFADSALRVVSEAFAFLSDLERKSLFDAELRANRTPAAAATPLPRRSFWTSCPACCHVFEYDRLYVDRTLLCRTCMRPFHASEMAGSPPIVPGTDMYYCAWGFFPLGFPGSGFPNSEAAGAPIFSKDWKPFHPVTPWWGKHAGEQAEKPLNAVPVNVAAAERTEGPNSWRKKSLPTRNRKVVAKKRVSNYTRKSALFGETDTSESDGLEASGLGGSAAEAPQGEGISNFDIDLDATEDLLGNLHDLPFV